MNLTVITLFLVFVIATLVITYFAAKRTSSADDFYTAGGGLTGWQNGLAIAGDYLSAASFLGIAGAIALDGYDGFYYSIGYLVGFLVVLFIVAEPMRNIGKYTIADMVTARFDLKKVRGIAALSTITIVTFYMIAQLVGAGALIQLLFGIDYWLAVIIVGAMMTTYVMWGGMTATSWVQIIKAVLLMVGMFVLSILVLFYFNFNLVELFSSARDASPHGDAYLNPGVQAELPLDTISLMLALVLGTAGLPHILLRFFTVKDAKTARTSVVVATWIIGFFYLLTVFLGMGALYFVGHSDIVETNPAGNMAAPMLAEALGGDLLFAFIAAVSFATILAVVAGLVLSGATAFAHDLYGHIIKKGQATQRQQMIAARSATLGVAVMSIILALAAQNLNVAFLVALAFAVAASANLPVIVFTIYWKRFNTTGAITGILSGLITALALVLVSPSVLSPDGDAIFVGTPLFPLENPAIISVPVGFLGAIIGTYLAKTPLDKEKYREIKVKAHTGYSDSDEKA
ncbi:cation/acetate symporter ActP [Salicibibacter halophilus]|uniref:Cation/acetate symporter ActP n=1 Tax=Salicibibacter halophilus TaxID=2502791 RepID=A0A514LGL8_9BACI|nr:sodium/solute symporter [Salicibibacter halophilus]QDI90994.1 cation/acetate symporter ActP [Salicibibacter halophilus]